MKTERIFCSACDHEVHVVLTDIPSTEGHATLPDVELVCLEIGETCTGSMCPLGAESPEVMASRLAHSGFAQRHLPTVQAHCDACDRATALYVLPKNFVSCSECGATRRWTVLQAE
jgi:hypothetical protein